MILKPTKKANLVVQKEEPKKSKKKESMPKDTYDPLFTPSRLLVSETPNIKNPTQVTKKSLEFKVMRFGDDGLPYVFVSTYQESEFYTGYCQGKTISFPLEMLYSVIEELEDLSEKCDDLGVE